MTDYIDTDEHLEDVENLPEDEVETAKYPDREDDCLFNVVDNCTFPIWGKYLKGCIGKENCDDYIPVKKSTEEIV
jgi:hypothetical protein